MQNIPIYETKYSWVVCMLFICWKSPWLFWISHCCLRVNGGGKHGEFNTLVDCMSLNTLYDLLWWGTARPRNLPVFFPNLSTSLLLADKQVTHKYVGHCHHCLHSPHKHPRDVSPIRNSWYPGVKCGRSWELARSQGRCWVHWIGPLKETYITSISAFSRLLPSSLSAQKALHVSCCKTYPRMGYFGSIK